MKKSVNIFCGFSLTLVIKNPNKIEKNIIDKISPFAKALNIFVGIIFISVSPKDSLAAERPSTSEDNPKSAPTPGLIILTSINPVIIANVLVDI